MADVSISSKGYTENPDLLPIAKSQQRYGGWTWTLMMFSMNTCIPMFFLGPIGLSLGLNFWQALWGALIGNLAAVIVMWLNGVFGVRHRIGYAVQLRESFGFRGAHVPVVLRGLSGLMWFGIEAWAGSLAITMIIVAITGVPKDMVTAVAIKYLVISLIFYLASFVVVMLFGLQGIGAMANWAGPIMLIYFIWLIIWLATQPQFAGNAPKLWVSKAGYFSLPFAAYLAVQTNWWATVALNISDISKGINPEKKGAFGIGLFVGIVLCQILATGLGFAAVTLTGQILPQQIIVQYAPGIVPALIGLLFAFLAPWSTDMTANSIPLFNILMSTFKMRWRVAVIVGSVIAFFAAPWWAVGNGGQYVDYITAWASNYGILLGPIAGIMIANYWIVRKQQVNVQRLYTKGEGGAWYSNGWSLAGFVSLVLCWVVCYVIAALINQMAYINIGSFKLPFPGGVIWYFAVVVALLLEWLFAGVFQETKK
ncbi:MAG TPA: cytosine permease [Spirochaetia bacterium]|nr:cytosine permease [Spirochaetia bacterium]